MIYSFIELNNDFHPLRPNLADSDAVLDGVKSLEHIIVSGRGNRDTGAVTFLIQIKRLGDFGGSSCCVRATNGEVARSVTWGLRCVRSALQVPSRV